MSPPSRRPVATPPPLFALLAWLGPRFKVIASDVTEGDPGNGERLAYIYDSPRVQPSGLVGEIVLPKSATGQVDQFARTPYAAGFVRDQAEFILTTVHVLWGKAPEDRISELAAFAEWMRGWPDRPQDWNRNLLVLGDFNLDRIDDPLFQAFTSTGLWPPPSSTGFRARSSPTTGPAASTTRSPGSFSDPADPGAPDLLEGLTYTRRGGGFDFLSHVLPGLTKTQVSWRISDHYPLWVEFEI